MRNLRGGRLAVFLAAAALAIGCASAMVLTHAIFALPQLLMLGGIAILVAFERSRYGAASATASAKATGERFRDPVSGQLTEVYYDDATGARSYRPIA